MGRSRKNRRKTRVKARPSRGLTPLTASELKDAGVPDELVGSVIVQREVSQTYHGPIPPPLMLAEYDNIVPGSAKVIISLFENQSNHRMALEKQVITSDIRRSWGGLVAGFVVCVLVLVASILLILNDHEVSGTVLGTVDLVSLVSVFVIGRKMQSDERVRKSEKTSRR